MAKYPLTDFLDFSYSHVKTSTVPMSITTAFGRKFCMFTVLQVKGALSFKYISEQFHEVAPVTLSGFWKRKKKVLSHCLSCRA